MQVSISGQHMDITAALKQHVSEKMEKIILHFDYVTNAQVVLRVEKEDNIVEANIHTKGASIHATGVAGDMYAAIDDMIAKLDRQVLKHKAKLNDHHRSEGGLKHAVGET
jgi:putative sigma-54 modulation protein